MKSYQLVEQLLKMVEKFESQTDANEMQLPNFVGFLNAQAFTSELVTLSH